MRAVPAVALVQASSRSWSGGRDYCLNEVDGVPALVHTLRVLGEALPGVPRVVIAPAFDATGPLADRLARGEAGAMRLLAAHDASPLRRMVAATGDLPDDAWALRVDAMSMFVDPRTVREMVAAVAVRPTADCYKTADDYPALLAVDLYRVGALRRALALLPEDDAHHVHPKFFMMREGSFRVVHHPPIVHWSDDELRTFRARAVALYHLAHGEAGVGGVAAGDQLAHHYERAAARIPAGATVLDLACGAGFGSALLAERGARVIAGDGDPAVVAAARRRYAAPNLAFREMDACATGLPHDAVDCVTSFETIEHTQAAPYLAELDRVLRPRGLFFLSTPQNCHGRVPINPWHTVEYDRTALRALLEPRFEILEFTGLKQGCVALPDDPVGQNSWVVMRSRKPEAARA